MRRKREKAGQGSNPEKLSTMAQDPEEIAQGQLLLATEDQWLADRLKGAAESTQRLLHANYFGSSPTGQPMGKTDFIELVQSGKQRGSEWRNSDRTMKLYSKTAISTGTVAVATPSHKYSYRYLRVYVNEGGQWLMIASLATEVPPANP
jgi:hypothetical protein